MPLARVISGGQTGVDRGVLDAALEAGFPCGGWCPPGRTAEDGTIPARYPLSEMPGGGYRERTLRNVAESGGTLLLCFATLAGGTEQTRLDCVRLGKPHLPIDGAEIPPDRAARLAAEFVERNAIAVLNVAGPRASESPQAYAYALETVRRLLRAAAPSAAKND